MRALLLVLLVACAGSSTRRVTLPSGGRAAAVPRWGVTDVGVLGDGRVVVASNYSSDSHGENWMQRGTGQVVAALSATGEIDWVLGAPSSTQYPHRIAAAGDGGVWILARTVGPFIDTRSQKISATTDHAVLVHANRAGHVESTVDVSTFGIDEVVYPVCLAAQSDLGVVAVLGSVNALYVARITNGKLKYMRRLDRGAKSELAPSLPVYCTSHGDTMWLAGAGTSLYVATDQELAVEPRAKAPDGTYQGPVVLELALATAEPRLHPLEPKFIPGGWGYPTGIAFVGGRVVLARRATDISTLTVHPPATFEVERTIYSLAKAEITQLANDDDAHVIALVRQTHHGIVRYGDRSVSTSTAPPTSSATVAVRVPVFDASPPRVVTVVKASDASGDGIGGDVGGGLAVADRAAVFVVGTFTGVLHIDERAQLRGTYGHFDNCDFEDSFHTPGCDETFWEAPSAFVIRIPTPSPVSR